MDPASFGLAVAATAASIIKVINQMREFAADARIVDATVEAFIHEIESLASVLDAIKDSFADIGPLAEHSPNLRTLWTSVGTTVENCQLSAAKLNVILRRLGKRSDNAYQAIIKQLKIKTRRNEIVNVRRRIAAYNTTFQTSISSVTLYVFPSNIMK